MSDHWRVGVGGDLTFGQKLWRFNWILALLLTAACCVGFTMQYSVAGGSMDPWASRQISRFGIGLVGMFIVAMIDIRVWRLLAYLVFAGVFVLLIGVMFFGDSGGGAQRWINLGFIRLQPSEVMKVALVLALARYYHDLHARDMSALDRGGLAGWMIKTFLWILAPLAVIGACAALILQQPDLGTAGLVAMLGLTVMFLGGVTIWLFLGMAAGAVGAVWAVFASRGTDWQILKDYQYRRIEVFISPENLSSSDSGYHIMQSKIALGSGGIFGKGFLEGTQSRLDFLPEKQTDFIFTALAEEFGLIGGASLLALYALILTLAFFAVARIRHRFGRLLAAGVAMNFFSYYAVNMAMVMGLMPVVGVPLPLVSYGGTSMWSLMFGFGLLMSASIHRQVERRRSGLGGGAATWR